mgnify:CR=1 FL=1
MMARKKWDIPKHVWFKEYFLNYPFGVHIEEFWKKELPAPDAVKHWGKMMNILGAASWSVGDPKRAVKPEPVHFYKSMNNILSSLTRTTSGVNFTQSNTVPQNTYHTLQDYYFWSDIENDIHELLSLLTLPEDSAPAHYYKYDGWHDRLEGSRNFPLMETIIGKLPRGGTIPTNLELSLQHINPVAKLSNYGPIFNWKDLSGDWDVSRRRINSNGMRTLSRLFNLVPSMARENLDIDLLGSARWDTQQWVTRTQWLDLVEEFPLLIIEWGYPGSRGWKHEDAQKKQKLDDEWKPGDMRLWLLLEPPLGHNSANLMNKCSVNESKIKYWLEGSNFQSGSAYKTTPVELSGNHQSGDPLYYNLDCLANHYPVWMLRMDSTMQTAARTAEGTHGKLGWQTPTWELRTLRNMVNPETMMDDDEDWNWKAHPPGTHPWQDRDRITEADRTYDNIYAVISLPENGNSLRGIGEVSHTHLMFQPGLWSHQDHTKWENIWKKQWEGES